MNYKIYIVAEKIDKFSKEAIKEYEKRLSRYCKIELVEIKDLELLPKNLLDKTYKIIISTTGQQLTSEELAIKINKFAISSKSDISLIIGAENIDYNESLSISQMEMDIGLKATIIFEQIYRAYRILNNQPYHK
jgi:23S rRNA (pseudouridine1915-N3)-methyltransferase